MEVPNPAVFHAYDIRGVWGVDFDASFAQRLASRVAAYLKSGPIIVGRDGRDSSSELAYALIDGAVHTGSRVLDIGHVSTPQMAWAIKELNASVGLMATASHNPGEYNGIKAIARNGHSLELIGGNHLRQIYDSHPHTHQRGGSIGTHDVIPAYAYAVAAAADWRGQEIVASVDAPIPVRCALSYIAPIASDHDMAVKFDCDGDRINFFYDGKPVASEWIFLLIVEHLKLSPLVFDLRFSRAVRERLITQNVRFNESAVGRVAMTENMRNLGAMFGGETSGHFYWRSFGNMESPELTLLNVSRILSYGNASLLKAIAPYIKYNKSPEVNILVKDRKAAVSGMERIAANYGKGALSRVDGISVDFWDSEGWWMNLRPSNTEPLLRLVIETKEKDLLATKLKEVQQLLVR